MVAHLCSLEVTEVLMVIAQAYRALLRDACVAVIGFGMAGVMIAAVWRQSCLLLGERLDVAGLSA